MRRVLTVAFSVLAFFVNVYANDYNRGAEAFKKGDYSRAAEIFQKIADETEPSGNLLYDLGTAYAAAGDLGQARLYLERAYLLTPGDDRIEGNLKYVVSKVDDANRAVMTGKRGSVEPDPVGFLGEMRIGIARNHTSNFWAILAATGFVLFLGSVALYLFASNILVRKVGFFSAIGLISISALFIIFSVIAKNERANHEYGVITAYKYELLEEPGNDSEPSASPLTQGTKVRIVSEEADPEGNVAWYKVRLNGNYLGWIPAGELDII